MNLGIDNPRALVYNIIRGAANTAKQTEYGRMAQLVEHRVHIAGVTGSSPVATTTFSIRNGREFFIGFKCLCEEIIYEAKFAF